MITYQISAAQEIPEPEFNARPYYLKDGELVNMERADARFDVKVKAFGYGGHDSFLTAFGSQSSVRFNKDALPRIFIKFDGNIDPEELISILKAETKKRKKIEEDLNKEAPLYLAKRGM